MKNKIFNKDIKDNLKKRLNSQRRIFNFDNKHILVLPFLEHNSVDTAVNNIKFYTSKNSDYKHLSEIQYIGTKDSKVVLKLYNDDTFNLFYKRLDGSLVEVQCDNFSFDDLSIDHTPSIYIVLYSHYLNKSKTFDILTNFCDDIDIPNWSTNSIKKGGFKKKVETILNESPNKDKILEAYNNIFSSISLEITLRKKNNANLSLESLEYYKRKN